MKTLAKEKQDRLAFLTSELNRETKYMKFLTKQFEAATLPGIEPSNLWRDKEAEKIFYTPTGKEPKETMIRMRKLATIERTRRES